VTREEPVRSPGTLEAWLSTHGGTAAVVLVVLGFLVRMLAARRSFVIADELLHADVAGAGSLGEVYRASLEHAHPPLFFLLLHFWKGIVGVGWQLCWLSVAFATLFLWAGYRWTRALLGPATALAALALFALLPQLVLLTAEVRGYSLMLLLSAAALAAIERGIAAASPRWLIAAAALAGLALLTHYAAARLVTVIFVYGSVRLLSARVPVRLGAAWVGSQAALGALFLFLFARQVSRLRGGSLESHAQADWLKASYFRPGEESAATFVVRQTRAFFDFLMMSSWAGIAAFLLVALAIGWLALRKSPAAVLLSLPFLLAAAGGLLRVYPYGGSRHSIDLALYACAAIALVLTRVARERLWTGLLLAAALLPAALAVGW
jgi:hypothetical protein